MIRRDDAQLICRIREIVVAAYLDHEEEPAILGLLDRLGADAAMSSGGGDSGVITDSSVLDWARALGAGRRIVEACHFAGFIAPEVVGKHYRQVQLIAHAMSDLAEALHIQIEPVVLS